MIRADDYPEEYTTGYVTFFGRRFTVNPHVLIPRLETEVLIKRARKILEKISHSKGLSLVKAQNGESESLDAPLPRGEDLPASVANQGGNLYYSHSSKAIPYNPSLLALAKNNRKTGNPVENHFWYDILKSGKLKKYRFTRQKPLLDFIVDFYCAEFGIVIELDGDSHNESTNYDNMRSRKLESYGLKVVRFTNQEIMMKSEGVIDELEKILESRIYPPTPLGRGAPEENLENLTLEKNSETIHRILTIDIGCGSGIIGTSITDLSTDIIFLDISEEALGVARENFENNFPTKKADFIVSDLLSGILRNPPLDFQHLLLLANLPYIKADDWDNMSADTHYEPKLALFGGEKTGFEMYERLFDEVQLLKSMLPETNITLLCEFGFDQREIAEEVLKGYTTWGVNFFADYRGIERFVEIHIV